MIWLDGGYTTAGGYSGSGPKWRTLPSMWIYSTNSGGTKSWRWLPEFKYDVNSPTYRYGGIYRDEYYGVRLRGGGRGGRGGGRWTSKPESPLKKYEIKGWGKAVDSSKQAAMSSMKPIIEEARLDAKATRFGTEFKSGVDLSNKRLGIGVFNGFIGGSGFSYGIQMATFSVYHRYRRYRRHSSPMDPLDFFAAYYEKNSCYQGCPPLSHCQWGLCECDSGHKKKWGLCRNSEVEATQVQQRLEQGERRSCEQTQDCHRVDINMVCEELESGAKECRCRKDMRWNNEAVECQLYLGVNCTSFNYLDAPSTNVANAALLSTSAIRGWTTEKDKRQKLFSLPRIQKMMEEAYNLFENRSVANHYKRRLTEDTFCPRESTFYAPAPGGVSDWVFNNMKRCKTSELLVDHFGKEISSIPTDRTQTQEEALEFSVWSQFSTFNMSLLSKDELDEAFCRDVESFSPAFTPRVRIQGNMTGSNKRPATCSEISPQLCAILFDSASCSLSAWSLEIADGTQKQLSYWSSDWKYRNDADVVGVRKGCSFSAWTQVGFEGDRFDLTALENERWVVFEEDPMYNIFHENIESFQCNCWGD